MRGVPQIEVTFEIDANGILKVSAKDLKNGNSQSKNITARSYISEEDIKQYCLAIDKIIKMKNEGFLIANSIEFLDISKKFIKELDWKCNGLSELRIDSDGKMVCCCDVIGNVNKKYSIFDLDNSENLNNFIKDIKADKNKVLEAYNDLLSFDVNDSSLNPEQIKEKVDKLLQALAKALGDEDWQDLKIRLGFEFVDDNASDYEKFVDRTKNKLSKFGGEGTGKLMNFFSANGIDSSKGVNEFLDVYYTTEQAKKGIYDDDVAMQEWIKHSKEASDTSTPTTLSSAWEQLKASTDDTTKGVADDLQALADKDSLDWKDYDADTIFKRVTEHQQPGSIVLFHNAALHTPEALPSILEYMHQNGYTVVPIGSQIYTESYTIDHAGRQSPVQTEAGTSPAPQSNPAA